jgi:hypothetical protein
MAAAASVALALSGCLPQDEPAPAAVPADTELSISDFAMTKVDDAGRDLSAAGFAVEVFRPEFLVESGPNTTKQGESFTVEELRAPFEPEAWDHWVTGQDPAPGTQVSAGSTVVLIAGEHLGASPGQRWIIAHGEITKKRGDDKCESCHKEPYCTDCHDKAGVKDEE